MIQKTAWRWRLAVVVLAVGVSVVGLRAGDEEEEGPKKPAKKVVVPEDDTPIAGANVLGDVARAAASATNPALKKYLSTLAVACDRVTLDAKTLRVVPFPLVWGKDKYPDEFGVAPLNDQNKPGEVQTLTPKDVRGVTHFEPYVLSETDRLLKGTTPDLPVMSERLAAAERVLSAALFYHDGARESRARRGDNWEPFKTAIGEKLVEVRLSIAQQAADGRQWDKLRDLVTRFGERYRTVPAVLQKLMALRLFEAVELVKSDKLADLEKARDILTEFESKFPNTGNEQAKQVRGGLAERAKKYLEEAARSTGSETERRNLLRNVEALAPDLEGLRERQKELKAGYATLVVGVKRMPRLMSPATAREDSERMAVELLFEGLIEPTPDPDLGTVYRQVLAAAKPRVPGPLLREVTLVGNADWGRPDGGAFDAADLRETVRLMREKRTLPSADRTDWLDDPALDPTDPARVRLRLKQGHPDPRELLAFKVLPGKYLAGRNKGIDDDSPGDSFARTPFGTGPFKLAPGFKPAEGDEPAKEVTFVPNGNYWRRPGRIGQPAIKEVRFMNLSTVLDPANEFRGDRLHLMTDVPTKDLDKYTSLPRVAVVTAANPRRIWTLAVNHQTLSLQSVDVRRGLLHAIDREAILNEVFRAGKKEFHKALTGPYPAGAWCAPVGRGAAVPLFNQDLATGKLRSLPDVPRPLTLLYPADDMQASEACQKIRTQIEACGKLTLVLEPVSPAELWTRVQQETRYDLAYVPFDYPDIWFAHALAAALDPTAAGRGGRNYWNYLVKATNPSRADDAVGQALAAVKQHRDTVGQLGPLSQELAVRFNEAVPFIPLWQLDRHIACSTNLKIYFDQEPNPGSPKWIDPIKVFQNVGRWRMDDGR